MGDLLPSAPELLGEGPARQEREKGSQWIRGRARVGPEPRRSIWVHVSTTQPRTCATDRNAVAVAVFDTGDGWWAILPNDATRVAAEASGRHATRTTTEPNLTTQPLRAKRCLDHRPHRERGGDSSRLDPTRSAGSLGRVAATLVARRSGLARDPLRVPHRARWVGTHHRTGPASPPCSHRLASGTVAGARRRYACWVSGRRRGGGGGRSRRRPD